MSAGYLVGIDPGAACGFGVIDLDTTSRVLSGTWTLNPRAHQGDGGRFVRLVENLDALLRTFPRIVSIAYEVPGHLRLPNGKQASPTTYLGLYGIVAHIESWAESHDLHYCGFAPQEVKKAATGLGNAKKAEVVESITRRFGLHLSTVPVTHNECDALAIALAGVDNLRRNYHQSTTSNRA